MLKVKLLKGVFIILLQDDEEIKEAPKPDNE